MGLVTELLALPAAPFRGVGWVLDKVVEAAEEECYDPAPVQEQLAELERERAAGRVSDEEFKEQEDSLLQRLEEIRAYQLRKAG
ncbi:gas vesicle protein GvpG [Streptomyces sp. NPDC101160]|uniref:gas vesicle protein GvpG n=1 Tax=Streptomyces sp. NPDC101160 TaxID=3366118 RepID=UPI0038111ABC